MNDDIRNEYGGAEDEFEGREPGGDTPLDSLEDSSSQESGATESNEVAGDASPDEEIEATSGMKRRDVVKALATVPFVGALGYETLRKYSMEEDRSEAIAREVGIELESPAFSEEAVSRSSQTIRIGIIGNGGEGESLVRSLGFAHPEWIQDRRTNAAEDPKDKHLQEWLAQQDLNVQITAVCDVFDVRAERAIAASTQPLRPGGDTRNLKPAKRYRHYEDLLASPDVDAVIIATPDHLHATITIAAARAGKHVYCEKCMTRTFEEVFPMADAVRESGIVFQLGHQNRQLESHEKAREVVAKGLLGPLTLVETTTNRNDPWGAWVWDIHPEGNRSTIDWDLFQIAAGNRVPFSLERFFRWRCWYDYGTGLSGDLLSHEYDAVNQILGLGIPATATASGGIYFFKDGRDVPDVFQAVFEYPYRDLTLVYSATLANGNYRGQKYMGHDATMEVSSGLKVTVDGSSTRYAEMLEDGTVSPRRPMLTYQSGYKGLDAVTTATQEYFASRGLMFTYKGGRRISTYYLHLKEWLQAIRDGTPVSCDIEQGVQEAVTCHMATKSFLEGRRVTWDPTSRQIV